MAARVGHITEMHEDGTCRAVNDITGEAFFGRLTIRSGGMITFDVVDERNVTVGAEAIYPEQHPDGDPEQHAALTKEDRRASRATRVAVKQ